MNDPEARVGRVSFAVWRFGVGGAIGARAQSGRGAVCGDGPFADIAAKIKDQFFVFFALAGESANLTKQRRVTRQFFDFCFEFRGVFWI